MSVTTGDSPYCTPATLLDVVDANQIADTLLDNGQRPSRAAMLDSTSEAGRKLLRKCREASGAFESYLLARGHYAASDLADVVAASGNTAALVEGIVGQVALLCCLQRRQPVAADFEAVAGAKLVLEALEALRVGERELGVSENVAAGEGIGVLPLASADEYGRTHGALVSGSRRLFGKRAADCG